MVFFYQNILEIVDTGIWKCDSFKAIYIVQTSITVYFTFSLSTNVGKNPSITSAQGSKIKEPPFNKKRFNFNMHCNIVY